MSSYLYALREESKPKIRLRGILLLLVIIVLCEVSLLKASFIGFGSIFVSVVFVTFSFYYCLTFLVKSFYLILLIFPVPSVLMGIFFIWQACCFNTTSKSLLHPSFGKIAWNNLKL